MSTLFRDAKKRSVDFNGQQVSYPQYLSLMALQKKVIKLDNVIKALKSKYTLEELQKKPSFRKMVDLLKSLEKLLPENHLEISSTKRFEFFQYYPQLFLMMLLQTYINSEVSIFGSCELLIWHRENNFDQEQDS